MSLSKFLNDEKGRESIIVIVSLKKYVSNPYGSKWVRGPINEKFLEEEKWFVKKL